MEPQSRFPVPPLSTDAGSEAERPAEESRRDFLRQSAMLAIGLGALGLSGAGCSELRAKAKEISGPAPAIWSAPPANGAPLAVHVLNRATFGPCPGDVKRVAEIGPAAFLEEQLADRMDENPVVNWRVGALDIEQTEQDAPDALSSMSDEQLLTETTQAALLRAVYSRRQLREVMADFWTNHFNIYALKNSGRELIPVDTERALRPHVLGRFRDLLTASAHSPAMLAYLDNNQNRKGPGDNVNENYARELLELHTLGVKSGYTQHDIHEVARCFTGWTMAEGFQKGQFLYDPSHHDTGAKYIPFLGLQIPADRGRLNPNSGMRDAQDVVDTLAAHPATARFISQKLCIHFLGHAPDDVVERASNAYLKSGSDIRSTLRPILLDALLSPSACKPILKRPLDVMVSALRALAADTDGGEDLQNHLVDMGQPLYEWPMPDGFPEKASSWTGALLPRWNFALALTANAIPGTSIDLAAPLTAAHARSDEAILSTLVGAIYGRSSDSMDLRPVCESIKVHMYRAAGSGIPHETVIAEAAALLLSAPQFQWK